MFYIEYLIGDDGIPRFLNSGDIRVGETTIHGTRKLEWIGLDLLAQLPPFTLSNSLTWAMRFMSTAAGLGYRGYINIDGIISTTGHLLFNEVNGRWGGGLVPHTIARRLIGDDYADRRVLSCVMNIPATPLQETLAYLRKGNLLYNPKTQEGILVITLDPTLQGHMECLLIGCSRADVRALETELRRMVTEIRLKIGGFRNVSGTRVR